MASFIKQTVNFSRSLDNIEEKFSQDLSYLEQLKNDFYLLDKESK